MGILWRLFAPKPLKKARRTVRRAAHPVGTVTWAVTPKPVKKVRRAASTALHPIEAAEFALENQVVHALRSGTTHGASKSKDGMPARFTGQWIRRTLPRLNAPQVTHTLAVMRKRGWTENDLRARVYPYTRYR